MGAHGVSQDHYAKINEAVGAIIKQNQKFERLVITREQALEMFKDNPFKVALISSKIAPGESTTVYRCGALVDLCRGPHLPATARVKAMQVEKHSSAYWLGKTCNDSLQRVYAISFPDAKRLKQHFAFLEEARKRDHRTLGAALNLFFFDTTASPGSCFWLPDGYKVYHRLQELMRAEYHLRGFEEVLTPNIFSSNVWTASGHIQNYKENMFLFDVESKQWGLKPMNCPGHCLMFKHIAPSYRQLPFRFAEFGVLHRNEISGSLQGLTRVRRFQQDDAHVFCRVEQIKAEVQAALDFIFFIYDQFGFKYELLLGTRPAKALGDEALWAQAEAQLKDALEATGKPWSLNAGDGAFYGPKIDFRLQDALLRWHQCGTLQLDFNLPKRFNLSYRGEEVGHKKEATSALPTGEEAAADGSLERELQPGHERPVMIHRAILGSLERFIAVLIEHTGGKLPFWLSPRQVMVCPISDKSLPWAKRVKGVLQGNGYFCALDDSSSTLNKKIRDAQVSQWSFIAVIGEKESAEATVTLRSRDGGAAQDQLRLDALLAKLGALSMPTSKLAELLPPV
eukprot:Selendium_serpulae@DN6491_c1_g1_i2.p1